MSRRHRLVLSWAAGLGFLGLLGCQASLPVAGNPAPVSSASVQPGTGPAVTAPGRVTPEQAKARLNAGENILVVDVRNAASYAAEHIEGAVNATWADIKEGKAQLPKDRTLLLYCT
ncbi:MAG: rhodanese-like domain-containing protein [Candidatus Sericytochromatia bacterium]|nr:rhodanese-like domain-containing protein [Candidatus Sericytochromatia bacterium]